MGDYKALAQRYLRRNQANTILTVLGVMLTVFLLYTGLNLAYGYLLSARAAVRSEGDYELIFFIENEKEAEKILEDFRIRSAYIGSYYDDGTETVYSNALYVNTIFPYRMNHIFTELTSRYAISGAYHQELAALYMQGEGGSYASVVIWSVLLIAYLLTVIGVGIVRNSIQLSMTEHMRDYGILCCMGSTENQIRILVAAQGLMLEGAGLLLGTLAGTAASWSVGLILRVRYGIELSSGFHLLPCLLTALLFIGDLLFVIREETRILTRLSPIRVVAGELHAEPEYELQETDTRRQRAKKTKGSSKPFRRERRSGAEKHPEGSRNRKHAGLQRLIWSLFGIEGYYAYRNLCRRPGRFVRTVAVFACGMTALLTLASLLTAVSQSQKRQSAEYGEYPFYVMNLYDADDTIEMAEAALPSAELMERLSEQKGVSETRRMYAAETYVSSPSVLYEHMTEAYLQTATGQKWEADYEASGEETGLRNASALRGVACYGYSAGDLEAYRSVLTAGTLDVSEAGVILVNRTYAANLYEDPVTGVESQEPTDVTYTDYAVGDTIELLDLAELHRRADAELEQAQTDFYAELERLQQAAGDDGISSTERTRLVQGYYAEQDAILAYYEEQLEAEGCYKCYTIEGIVSEDVNLSQNTTRKEGLRLLMLLDTYYELTGTDASQPTGMMYQIEKNIYLPALQTVAAEMEEQIYLGSKIKTDGMEQLLLATDCELSNYIDELTEAEGIRNRLWLTGVLAALLLLIFVMNILNTTYGSLLLRRGELTQLRILGTTRRQLDKMVVLEGFFAALLADGIGILAGTLIGYGLVTLTDLLTAEHLQFAIPLPVMLAGIAASLLCLCGSAHAAIRKRRFGKSQKRLAEKEKL